MMLKLQSYTLCRIFPHLICSAIRTSKVNLIFFRQKQTLAMPPKSNNQKKKEAEAAGRAPKKTKQQENAGKSASQKKAEMQVRQKMSLYFLDNQSLLPSCRLSVLPTRRRSLVDGNLNLDLCHQDLQCGCSIDFVKPFLSG